MSGVFLAERAIFIEFKPVGIILFILVNVVIPLFTFGAGKRYSNRVSFSHF